MAISLDSLNHAGDPAHVMIVHGPPGVGKTTMLASLPSPVMLQTERGKGKNEVPSWRINNFAELKEAFGVAVESGKFKTILADSLDHAEPLVWAEACRRNGWSSIEQPGYGRGYIEADNVWREIWEYIESAAYDMDMVVAMTAHSVKVRFEDPEGAAYDRWEMKMHKRARSFFEEKADMILFANFDTATSELKEGMQKRVIGKGAGTRSVYAEKRPAFDAKNRHDLPPKVVLQKPFDWEPYAAAFPEGYFA